MRQDFEKDREKMKRQIQLDFEKEKEQRALAAEKQKTELEKNVDLSKNYFALYLNLHFHSYFKGDDGSRLKNMRVDWSKPESKRIQVVVRSRLVSSLP